MTAFLFTMYDLSDQNSFTMCCLTHLVFKVVGPGLAVLDPPICGPAYWETKANDIVSSVQVTHLILFYSSKLICWHFALKQYL